MPRLYMIYGDGHFNLPSRLQAKTQIALSVEVLMAIRARIFRPLTKITVHRGREVENGGGRFLIEGRPRYLVPIPLGHRAGIPPGPVGVPQATMAAFSGCLARPIEAPDGILT